MRLRYVCALSVCFVASAALAVAAPQEVSVEEFGADLEQWVGAVNDFIGDVRFDDTDMRSFLDHYGEFSAMMDAETSAGAEENWEDEDWEEDSTPDMAESFQELLTFMDGSQYRGWAAENGLKADDWMRKSARILLLSQSTAMTEFFAMAEAQMQEQAGSLEEQREQMGEEMYEAMQASFKMMEMTREAWAELPAPTAAEEQLIADHMDEISQLIGMDEGDEWGAP